MTEVRAWQCDDCPVLAKPEAARDWLVLQGADGDLHYCPAHAESGRGGQGKGSGAPAGRALPPGALGPVASRGGRGRLAARRPGSIMAGSESRDAPDGRKREARESGAAASADAVTVVQVSFRIPVPGGQDAIPRTGNDGAHEQVRLRVEEKVATVPRGSALDKLAEMARVARLSQSARDDFARQTAAYVAGLVDDFPVKVQWESLSPLTPMAVDDALGRFQQALLTLVGKPIECVAVQAGAGPSGAQIAAGIGADALMARESGLVQRVSLVIDAAGMVFGAVTGMHPLAVACAHQMEELVFRQLVTRGVTRAIDGLFPGQEIQRVGRDLDRTQPPSPRGSRAADTRQRPDVSRGSTLPGVGHRTRPDRGDRSRGIDGPGRGFGVG